VALAVLALAATYRPPWYSPAAVDHARLPADKRELVNLLDRIGESLNNGRAASFELRAEQVQRWLVARTEIWPEAAIDLGPLRDPLVTFEGGQIRVGATLELRGVRAVLSATCRVEVREGIVLIRHGSVRLGALPVPRTWVARLVAGLPPSGQTATAARDPGVIALANDWTWPNGRRRYRLREFQVSDGCVKVTLEPLATKR